MFIVINNISFILNICLWLTTVETIELVWNLNHIKSVVRVHNEKNTYLKFFFYYNAY